MTKFMAELMASRIWLTPIKGRAHLGKANSSSMSTCHEFLA